MVWLALGVLCVPLVLVAGYPDGPPIGDANPTLCTDMDPSPGHGGAAQTGTPYFEIRVNNNCAKPGQMIQVQVQLDCDLADNQGHIEGLFLQARVNDNDLATNDAIGTFTTTDTILDVLTCGSTANNAIGHNEEKEAYARVATWTAPDDLANDVVMYATVVHNEETYWVGLASENIQYDDACVEATAAVPAPTCGAAQVTATFLLLAMALLGYMAA